jgi:hypothetical protein
LFLGPKKGTDACMFDINDYVSPALLLNVKGVIIGKNKAAGVRCAPFRKGSSISRYLNKSDYKAIKALKSGEYTVVTLNGIGFLPAIVFFDGNSYLVRINAMAVALNKRIESLCNLQQRGLMSLSVLASPSIPENSGTDTRIRHLLYMQQRISEYISMVIGSTPATGQMCDINKMLKDICEGAKNVLRHISADILFIDSNKRIITYGVKRDLEYIFFSCITLCFFLSNGRRIDAKITPIGSQVIISFCFEDFKSPDLVKELEKCIDESDFENTGGETAFILMHARALCEMQNGKLTLSRLPSGTKALISVTLKTVDEKEEMLLESPNNGEDYTGKAFFALAGVKLMYGI